VDEDAAYVPVSADPVLVVEGSRESHAASLAYNGTYYGVTFTNKLDTRSENTFKGIGRNGETAVVPTPITHVNTDTYGGTILWTGATFATGWDDRRDGDFEIYFNRLNASGEKLAPDARITNAPDFSLGVDMIWNGSEYVLVWRDRRNDPDDYQIFGQRIRANGELIGDNVELTPPGMGTEAPRLAQGTTGLGLIFNAEAADGTREVVFRKISPDLTRLGDLVVVGDRDAVEASIVFNGDRFVLGWHKTSDSGIIGSSIYGAALAESGEILISERPITAPAAFARSHSILPLGDRLILVWAADHDGTFDLYTKMLSNWFDDLSDEQRVTNSPSNAVGPAAAFGPDGDIGVVFDDVRTGSWQAYFTRLTCLPGVTSPD
jgi:hypothetical protein